MNIEELFSTEYLLDPVPDAKTGFTLYFLIFFGALVLLSLATKFIFKTDKKIRDRQFYSFLTCGILGLVYVFARYEGLPWLASRLYLVLVLALLLIWLVFITVWTAKHLKESRNKKDKYEKYNKYLPNN